MMVQADNCAAIVLAAGKSSRMGRDNKLLLPVQGRPMIVHSVLQIQAAGIKKIIVVTGFQDAQIKEVLQDFPVMFVKNEQWDAGMGGSISRGISVLDKTCDCALVVLADMPFVPADVIRAVISAKTDDVSAVVPVYEGRRGHPVLWTRRHFAELQTLKGDKGARDLLALHNNTVRDVVVNSETIFRDIDTPEDLI